MATDAWNAVEPILYEDGAAPMTLAQMEGDAPVNTGHTLLAEIEAWRFANDQLNNELNAALIQKNAMETERDVAQKEVDQLCKERADWILEIGHTAHEAEQLREENLRLSEQRDTLRSVVKLAWVYANRSLTSDRHRLMDALAASGVKP